MQGGQVQQLNLDGSVIEDAKLPDLMPGVECTPSKSYR
jgi:hypothetical protein